MTRLVDDIKGENGLWIKSYSVEGVRYQTQSYRRWNNMKIRCNDAKNHPKYIGCTISENFKDFQYFTDWNREQIGYSESGYELDKDILFPGNREYSEELCVLIPKDLNSFFSDRKNTCRIYPSGVYRENRYPAPNPFRAQISIDGKRVHLEMFTSVDAAQSAYMQAKEAECHRWYERLVAGEFIVDPRVIECMRTWKLHNYEK